jgi:hypothetical protein
VEAEDGQPASAGHTIVATRDGGRCKAVVD